MSPERGTRITRVRTVAIPVADNDRALAFYVGELGFEKTMDASFGGGQRWVEVAPPGSATSIALIQAEGEAGVETQIPLSTTDAEADHADLLARGVDVDPELMHLDGTPPMFTFRDPDRNTLVIVEAD